MIKEKLPSVLIGQQAWEKICAEVSYWANKGKREGRGPLESVFYPLAAVKLQEYPFRTPFDLIELSDVKQFIIGDVFLPPREFVDYSSCSAQFRAREGDEERMQKAFSDGVSEINRLFPQLLFLGPGHSHPFAIDDTFPSRTDVEHHIRPYRRKNEELLGFNFSLALIIVQDSSRRGWQACAFAMDKEEQLRYLGLAQVLPKRHRKINCARAKPFYRTRRGRIWEARQKAQLRDRLIEHERWPGGWTSFLIKHDQQEATLVMVPPRFPRESPLEQNISLATRHAGSVSKTYRGTAYRSYELGGKCNGQYPKAQRTGIE
jgi:hypothetical protein